jgi:tRNA 2-selenouridine synthase
MSVSIHEFLDTPGEFLDVRTPAEFLHGRIPDSFNLPLFSNEERAIVGTIYKKIGRVAAVDKGFRLVGPRMADIALEAKSKIGQNNAKVLCWRGGMRSSAVAWILNMSGMKAVTLEGGYKNFRRWSLKSLEKFSVAQLHVVGGLTGCGKTHVLQELKKRGEQVLDLEDIACHRGSSFGGLGMPEQPSNEQFENNIAWQMRKMDMSKPIWIEDESILIGKCKLPNILFTKMKTSSYFFIERTQEERIDNLMQVYGGYPTESLIDCTKRIQKRLGGAVTKKVLELFEVGETKKAFEGILSYYDKAYLAGISRDVVNKIITEGMSWVEISNRLLGK